MAWMCSPYLDPDRVRDLGRKFLSASIMLIGLVLFVAQCQYPHSYSETVYVET